ncbi:hypothetical protein IFE17_11150 [Actinobacillus sp. GY-402]|nr:hypothetical protein IFE17_11150 [Actinobacillus sp. GY-402]
MSNKSIFIALTVIMFSLVFYGLISGETKKHLESISEYNNLSNSTYTLFKNNIIDFDGGRGVWFEVVFDKNFEIKEYISFILEKGFVKRKDNIYCKNKSSIILTLDSNQVKSLYKVSSDACE